MKYIRDVITESIIRLNNAIPAFEFMVMLHYEQNMQVFGKYTSSIGSTNHSNVVCGQDNLENICGIIIGNFRLLNFKEHRKQKQDQYVHK